MKIKKDEDDKLGANAKRHRRADGTVDSAHGHPGQLPGSGADFASTDMEVPEPSGVKE
ncbi:MAG: hypothetical protein H7318_12025 [Oligoflexus sp.]|nr:hypothetical protein [Oligoflexus sp.]